MTRRRIEGPLLDRVEYLALQTRWTPAQIHRDVTGGKPHLVSLRTVQRVVTETRGADDSGPWSSDVGDPEDVAAVLPVVRWAIEQGAPRPSIRAAEWIARIRRACPDIDDLATVAYLARACATGGAVRDRAEVYLAFAPWRDGGKALARAYGRGLVSFDVVHLAGLEHEAAIEQRRAREARETGPMDPFYRTVATLRAKKEDSSDG